jgi:rubrerythrin
MESAEWEITATLRRRPGTRTALGMITEAEFAGVWDKMVEMAYKRGFTLSGLPRAKRTNCPHCGRIVRNPVAKRCPMCGVNFETGKVG